VRVLVTGAGGMLGSAVVPWFAQMGHEVLATDRRLPDGASPEDRPFLVLDVAERSCVDRMMAAFGPDLVIHLAAETNLEWCETHPDDARRTNAEGTENVARECHRAAVPLVYVSTAGVFDGEQPDPYEETDTPNPVNVYGHTKLMGERHVEANLTDAFVVRAGWMVGGGRRDHKFVAQIVTQLGAGARQIHAVTDRFGSPTYAPDFAVALERLVRTAPPGLYHMTCEGAASRFDVARQILDCLGRDDVALVPVTSDRFADRFPTRRPRSEILRNRALEDLGAKPMRPWQHAIAEYLATTDFRREPVGARPGTDPSGAPDD
jgi:dTDP-4-dehydrorhamnose reductase